MSRLKKLLVYFTPFEYCLWGGSLLAIALSFFLCGNTRYLNLAASVVGACALLFVAKGNPIGQALTVLFSALYGYISFTFRYYGEMATYLGMTAPIAVAALVAWLKHPFGNRRAEVRVNALSAAEYGFLAVLAGVVTLGFYFLLRALDTPNLAMSTVSVFTSFVAAYLTVRRSPLYALGYALNDVVLIVLWSLAAREDSEFAAMIVCFCVFLANDAYGLFQWLRMKRRQSLSPCERTQAENAPRAQAAADDAIMPAIGENAPSMPAPRIKDDIPASAACPALTLSAVNGCETPVSAIGENVPSMPAPRIKDDIPASMVCGGRDAEGEESLP